MRKISSLVFLLVLVSGLLSACAPSDGGQAMAPLADMPEAVRQSPKTVQDSYRFAVANPDVLKEIPCYCGCGGMGHTSNYACYVKSVEGGEVTFDEHALGCSICVDITVDTMRLMGEGKSTAEIKAYVDQTYSQYGPSNIP